MYEKDLSEEQAVLQAAIDYILSFPMKTPDEVPSELASQPSLIRLEFGPLVLYPAFQFRSDATQELVEEINGVLKAQDDPWAVASWWFSPNPWTDDQAMPYTLLDDPLRFDELTSLAQGEVADDQSGWTQPGLAPIRASVRRRVGLHDVRGDPSTNGDGVSVRVGPFSNLLRAGAVRGSLGRPGGLPTADTGGVLDVVVHLPMELDGVLVVEIDAVLDTVDREADRLATDVDRIPVEVIDELYYDLLRHLHSSWLISRRH